MAAVAEWVKMQREGEEFHVAAYGGARHALGGFASLYGVSFADRTWRSRFFDPLWVAQTLLTERLHIDAGKYTQSAVTIGALLDWSSRGVEQLLALRKEDVAGDWHIQDLYKGVSRSWMGQSLTVSAECATLFASPEKQPTQESVKAQELENLAKEDQAKLL